MILLALAAVVGALVLIVGLCLIVGAVAVYLLGLVWLAFAKTVAWLSWAYRRYRGAHRREPSDA